MQKPKSLSMTPKLLRHLFTLVIGFSLTFSTTQIFAFSRIDSVNYKSGKKYNLFASDPIFGFQSEQINEKINVLVTQFDKEKFDVQLFDKNKLLGTISTIRKEGFTKLNYQTHSRDFLTVEIRQGNNSVSKQISISTISNKITLTEHELLGKLPLSPEKVLLFEESLSDFKENSDLQKLVRASGKISSDYATLNLSRVDCAEAVTECILAAAAWVGGVGGLISLCGGTLGLSCVGAILIHPVLGAAVGIKCGKVSGACAEVAPEVPPQA